MIRQEIPICLLLLLVVTSIVAALEFDEDNDLIRITTDLYELDWHKSPAMGYSRIQLTDSPQPLISGGENSFRHGSDYAGGFRYWEAQQAFNVIEETPTKLVLEYIAQDSVVFEYHCTATYEDGAPYILHEVYARNNYDDRDDDQKPANDGAAWPVSGYDPMLIPLIEIEDMAIGKSPLPYVVYWTPQPMSEFLGLYATDPKTEAKIGDWRGDGQQIQLDNDMFMKWVAKGEVGNTLTYYLAFGEGGEGAAADMAIRIFNLAVEPGEKLPVTWGQLKHP